MVFLLYVFYMLVLSAMIFMVSVLLYLNNLSLILEWLVVSLMSKNMELMIMLDWVSLMFMSIVLMISSLVLWYSVIYMLNDKNLYRFYYLVILFVLSMLLMIISPNLISIMLGWDGLGLVSYCLVIYYQNYVSYNSGLLTVLMNRVGDIMILMLIGMMFMYGSWNMFFVSSCKMMVLMIMIAGMTKSAQIPFSSWLPKAMAAPTPVSALVHSSTLVTAGVYLLIRFSSVLMESGVNKILLLMSMLTMFMSGLMANFEYDLKKIIALSTLSQLGLMMVILSVGFPLLSFYHLLTHAIFKSMLFLGAGVIIHCMMNNQDIRMLGGLNEYIPFTMMSFYMSLMSLCGFPFMSGFYSKDLIMEMIYMSKFNLVMFFMSMMSLMLTIMYSIRLGFYMFYGSKKFLGMVLIREDSIMCLSMILLMLFSVILGNMLNWMFFFESVFLSVGMKLMTLSVMVMSLLMKMMMDKLSFIKMYYLSYFLSSMWFLNYLIEYMPIFVLKISASLFKMDKSWMEFYSKMLILNMFMEYKNKQMNYKYKINMFLNWIMIFMVVIVMVM